MVEIWLAATWHLANPIDFAASNAIVRIGLARDATDTTLLTVVGRAHRNHRRVTVQRFGTMTDRTGGTKIPWGDAAVLVSLRRAGDREIVAEGTLRQMVNRIAARPPAEWNRFSISLPDRAAFPFAFESDAFNDLILAMG